MIKFDYNDNDYLDNEDDYDCHAAKDQANLLMQVIWGIIMIIDDYHDHNYDDDHDDHDDHHYQYDKENCVVVDYVELNKKR